jgi:NAD(P)-dependent dehydrogenase (short-subunit alcohol dehydrogenase family)
MMRTMLITGGTDGMGAALARHYLRAGDQVIVVGRSQAKFRAMTHSLRQDGLPSAAERAEFQPADLSLLADAGKVVTQVRQRCDRLDALVLAASFIRRKRHLTLEGHEASWALFFLSRHLLVTGLAPLLDAARRPVIINISVPGAPAGAIAFDDLESAARFSPVRANAQQRRANELLGIPATASPRLSYVTWGPRGLVRTSFAGDLGPALGAVSKILAATIGKDPDAAIRPLIGLIDAPRPGRAAYRGARPVPLVTGDDDEHDARRLAAAVGPRPYP